MSPGGSDDYAIDKGGVPFSYTLELGAEDLNFAVPLPLLNKTLQEGWVAVRTMSLEVLKF